MEPPSTIRVLLFNNLDDSIFAPREELLPLHPFQRGGVREHISESDLVRACPEAWLPSDCSFEVLTQAGKYTFYIKLDFREGLSCRTFTGNRPAYTIRVVPPSGAFISLCLFRFHVGVV